MSVIGNPIMTLNTGIIRVKAMSGSTIAFTKGSLTYTVSSGTDTGDGKTKYYSQRVPYGTWTVTGTWSSITSTASATVNSPGTTNVTLVYKLYIIQSGKIKRSMTTFNGPNRFEENSGGYVYLMSNGVRGDGAYRQENLTNYKSFKVDIYRALVYTGWGNNAGIGVSSSALTEIKEPPDKFIGTNESSARSFTIDVSGQTGNKYLYIQITSAVGEYYYKITNFYLESY